MLTKGVPREKHQYCCKKIGMAFISDREAIGMSETKHALTSGAPQGEDNMGPTGVESARISNVEDTEEPESVGGVRTDPTTYAGNLASEGGTCQDV